MKLKLAAVAVALLMFTTGAAMAMPGNAPDAAQADEHSQAGDHQPDDPAADQADDAADDDSDEAAADERDADNESAERRGPPSDAPAPATADAADANSSQGPPVDLPDAVPDFVSEIHELIGQHLDGALDGSLGEAISGVTPDDGDAADEDSPSENAGNATDAMPGSVPAGR